MEFHCFAIGISVKNQTLRQILGIKVSHCPHLEIMQWYLKLKLQLYS